MKYGLDFGTTNSAIALAGNGDSLVQPIDEIASDPRVVRSLLYFERPKNQNDFQDFVRLREEKNLAFVGQTIMHLIGQIAINRYLEENKHRQPGRKVRIYTGRAVLPSGSTGLTLVDEFFEYYDYGVGRLMQALKTGLKSPSFKGTLVFGKFFTLEELISIFVGELKRKADLLNKKEINTVVCGRPVYFSEDPIKDSYAQDRLAQALKMVGFESVSFEFEPVAAAHQYLAESGSKKGNILVFDFGGGTLDTAIVKTQEHSEVLAVDGVYIGGDLLNSDIFNRLLRSYFGGKVIWGEYQLPIPEHILQSLSSWFSISNLNNQDTLATLDSIKMKCSDSQAVERLIHLILNNLGFDLYEAIEKAKKELSSQDKAQIVFKDGPIDIDLEITRAEFEEIIAQRVDEIRKVVMCTLETAKLKPSQIDVVVRTGGSSLIPVFENMLVEIFGKQKIQQFETFTSIAAGLALE